MGNVFQTEAVLHRRFDLKGSTHGRTAGARAADPAAILKARRWRSCWYRNTSAVRIQANDARWRFCMCWRLCMHGLSGMCCEVYCEADEAYALSGGVTSSGVIREAFSNSAMYPKKALCFLILRIIWAVCVSSHSLELVPDGQHMLCRTWIWTCGWRCRRARMRR